ncbi:hypothetical protein ACHQM5_007916 [Ranunculus cassubicifolius]
MKRRSKPAAAAESLVTSPNPLANSNRSRRSPPSFDFELDLKGFNNNASFPSSSKKKNTVIATTTSVLIKSNTTKMSPSQKTIATISDLKDLVSSRSDSLKRNIEISHSDILKELEASHSRLSKRFKMHTQACQQVMEETNNENDKLSDWIVENVASVSSSYAEIIKTTETSANQVCKTSIPALAQSTEKAIESLRKLHKIPINAT